MFVEILKTDPDAVNPYNSLGVQLRRKGDIFGALHAYGQALALTPDDEHLHFNISKANLFAGNKDKAVEHLLRSLEINPALAHARELLTKIRTHNSKKVVYKPANMPAEKNDGMAVDK